MTSSLGPLRFERRFVEKVWGGRALERRLGIQLPEGPIGETWEVVDRADENSVVAEGPDEGATLRALVEEYGEALLGASPATKDGRFPLLVKYIDASQNLSVQVHPDEETAERLGGGAEGKTEAWYVVDVAEGGALYVGLRPEVTRERFAEIADGPGVVDALQRWDVRPGDCLLVPGGTVHAIGAGVTILEVQQNSDTTYRIWDWGRVGLDGKPRETHLDQALASARFGAVQEGPRRLGWEARAEGVLRARAARSLYFEMNTWEIATTWTVASAERFVVYAVVAGQGSLTVDGTPWRLLPGDVWLVPAACGERCIASTESSKPLRLVEFAGNT